MSTTRSWWDWPKPRFLPATKHDLEKTTRNIMAKINELAPVVTNLAAQVEKIKTEVEAIKAALEGADNIPPEVEAAVARLTTAVQQVDDLAPDAPVP